MLVREYVEHACDRKRIRGINALDPAFGDRGGDDDAMREAGTLYSAAYFAAPVTFARPSTREVGLPR